MDPKQNVMYLVSLTGYDETQALILFGPGTLDVAKRTVEQQVKEHGVPEPWVGYKIEWFEGGALRGSIDYSADCETHENPDWRDPGECEWKWDDEFTGERCMLGLALELQTASETALCLEGPPEGQKEDA